MSDFNPQLIQHIERLTELTKSGKVHWQRANPTVFLWDVEANGKKSRTTIQEARNRVRTSGGGIRDVKTYLFQIQDMTNKANAVFVDSKERAEYQQPMEDLYVQAGLSIDAKTAEMLGNLLGDLGL
jgi:hypothetical protein